MEYRLQAYRTVRPALVGVTPVEWLACGRAELSCLPGWVLFSWLRGALLAGCWLAICSVSWVVAGWLRRISRMLSITVLRRNY